MAEQKLILTEEGKRKLDEEYRHLVDVERPEVIEALQAARAQGDLSENADYDTARDKQAHIEARIREIEYTLNNATIVKDAPKGSKAGLGSVITYKEVATGEKASVKLVGTVEVDPMAETPLISIESAVGKALVGKSKGDVVTVEAEAAYDIEIVDVAA